MLTIIVITYYLLGDKVFGLGMWHCEGRVLWFMLVALAIEAIIEFFWLVDKE